MQACVCFAQRAAKQCCNSGIGARAMPRQFSVFALSSISLSLATLHHVPRLCIHLRIYQDEHAGMGTRAAPCAMICGDGLETGGGELGRCGGVAAAGGVAGATPSACV
eukprot:5407235-Pyramimonas_sp.AAC.1